MRLSRLLFACSAVVFFLERSSAQNSAPPASPAATPAPAFIGELSLARYDLPRGRSDGYAPTRQLAKRKDAPDGVDWPDLTLNGRPIFRDRSEEKLPLELRKGRDFSSPFQLGSDNLLQPGAHWFRALEWRLGRRHIYTADSTARTANAGEAMSGRYELWTFPILIKGEGGPVVKNVDLRVSGQLVYHKAGPWRTLTLLLPASEAGKPYGLSVDGRPEVKFEAGLQPVKLGDPHENVIPLNVAVAGDGPKIAVMNLVRPEEFPNQKEWDADLAALKQPLPARLPGTRDSQTMSRYLGVEVPVSPMTIYATALSHGMSAGFYKQPAIHGVKPFPGDAEAYASYLADTGYDVVFDPANALPEPSSPDSFEQRAAALGRHGVKLGLQYDNNWSRPALQHPNVAIFSHTLPEWHAPLYRSLSLAAQRFDRLPNFAGFDIGADSGGYVSDWHWAPPVPDRPWGEAMIPFMGTTQPKMPRAPSLGARELSYETPVKTQAEFTKYVERYETSFRQYGYFAEAVREVDPKLIFTTGSFGSAPGTGGRGGWPSASLPGRVIFEGLGTQQAYDWNELHASKPLHNVALVDRLRSYTPKKRTWALIDNFRFLFGREAFQRAYALALTRGIQGIGTNFLANPSGDSARPDVIAFQKEMFAWIRKYGGVYARTEPEPAIGIFYGHLQAVQRPVLSDPELSPEKLLGGSHEGKVAEALFLCHAAGWPARVITFQEVMRGPLPASMKAVLFVGLEQFDASWEWGPGLAPKFADFVKGGGRILADDTSSSPVPATKPGLRVAAYVPQDNFDPTPKLLARNAENIAHLRTAMSGVPPPIAASSSPTLWAIPTAAGDTQYVTVVNQAFAEGAEAAEMLLPADPKATKPELWKTMGNASLFVKPQTGSLDWNTERPIYDVRLSRKVSREEAATVDLTKDGFRWYALPPAEVTQPAISLGKGTGDFYEATVTIKNPLPMSGLPVRIDVQRGEETVSVFASTGLAARLPINSTRERGEFTVTATELLTGLAASKTARVEFAISDNFERVQVREPAAVKRFATRKNAGLTIALTPEQEQDRRFVEQAQVLADFYKKAGRTVAIGSVRPGALVEHLQPLKSPHRYPQWKTAPTDLILIGTPQSNVLFLDQLRAQIFPLGFTLPEAGNADLIYTRSPFVGECDALNLVVSDPAGLAAAVKTLTAPVAK